MRQQRPRRTRRAVVAVIGIAMATAMSGGASASAAPAGPDRASADGAAAIPVSADLRITTMTMDAEGERQTTRETGHFYRDSQGRTRTEIESLVTIYDPTSGTTLMLDTATRTYQQQLRDAARPALAARDDRSVSDGRLVSTSRSLGEAVINGVRTEGVAQTVTLPAWRGLPSQQKKVDSWRSTEVQLPVRTRVVDETGAVYQRTYTNIEVGAPAADLFAVPAGYREADVAPLSAPSPQPTQEVVQCPIAFLPVVPIVSTGGFLGSTSVPAITDPNQGCSFVADLGQFSPPMAGFPVQPLGLPIDEWFVFDTGGPIPFFPFTVFGVVNFAADNPFAEGPATVVASLVILDIFL